jgi:hypothetical protein
MWPVVILVAVLATAAIRRFPATQLNRLVDCLSLTSAANPSNSGR